MDKLNKIYYVTYISKGKPIFLHTYIFSILKPLVIYFLFWMSTNYTVDNRAFCLPCRIAPSLFKLYLKIFSVFFYLHNYKEDIPKSVKFVEKSRTIMPHFSLD